MDAARQQIAAYLKLDFTERLLCTGSIIRFPGYEAIYPQFARCSSSQRESAESSKKVGFHLRD
jgi:hypothetical protein